jgi:hypothetical protein
LVVSPLLFKFVDVVVPTREYVPVLDVDRYTSYPLAPFTATQLAFILLYDDDSALTEVGVAGIGFAFTTAE